MRILKTATCLPLLAVLAACGTPDQGHYDANGVYVPPPNPTRAQRIHSPDPGSAYDEYYDQYGDADTPRVKHRHETTVTTTYDDNGNRVTRDIVTENNISIPPSMMPPKGMCRVWFPNRAPEDEPKVESCEGIRQRAPEGSFVIYSY